MASSINALTSGGGGLTMVGDATGNLNLQSNGSTVVAMTATGVAVTGTLAVSGGVTLTTTLPVLQGGTGVTTSTGTTNVVLSNSPTLVSPSISSAVMTTMASSVITSGTTQTAPFASPTTFVTFTGIPSWAKRITVMLNQLGTNGTVPKMIQIGSTTFTTSGYIGASTTLGAGVGTSDSTVGFLIYSPAAANDTGIIHLAHMGSNMWVASGVTSYTGHTTPTAGSVTLPGVLDRLRIGTLTSISVFDAGSINILYE